MRSACSWYIKESRRRCIPVYGPFVAGVDDGVVEADLTGVPAAAVLLFAAALKGMCTPAQQSPALPQSKSASGREADESRVCSLRLRWGPPLTSGGTTATSPTAMGSPPFSPQPLSSRSLSIFSTTTQQPVVSEEQESLQVLTAVLEGVRQAVLQSVEAMHTFELTHFPLALHSEPAARLLHAVAMCSHLRVLRLDACSLTAANLMTLTATSRTFGRLQEASFSECGLTDRCQRAIVSLLKLHRDYEVEAAWSKSQRDGDDVPVLYSTTSTSVSLQQQQQLVGTTNSSSVRRQRMVRGLKKLDLSGNSLSDATLMTITHAIQQTNNTSLEYLNLSRNQVTTSGLQRLLISGMLEESGLQCLDLSQNPARLDRPAHSASTPNGSHNNSANSSLPMGRRSLNATVPATVQQQYHCIATEDGDSESGGQLVFTARMISPRSVGGMRSNATTTNNTVPDAALSAEPRQLSYISSPIHGDVSTLSHQQPVGGGAPASVGWSAVKESCSSREVHSSLGSHTYSRVDLRNNSVSVPELMALSSGEEVNLFSSSSMGGRGAGSRAHSHSHPPAASHVGRPASPAGFLHIRTASGSLQPPLRIPPAPANAALHFPLSYQVPSDEEEAELEESVARRHGSAVSSGSSNQGWVGDHRHRGSPAHPHLSSHHRAGELEEEAAFLSADRSHSAASRVAPPPLSLFGNEAKRTDTVEESDAMASSSSLPEDQGSSVRVPATRGSLQQAHRFNERRKGLQQKRSPAEPNVLRSQREKPFAKSREPEPPSRSRLRTAQVNGGPAAAQNRRQVAPAGRMQPPRTARSRVLVRPAIPQRSRAPASKAETTTGRQPVKSATNPSGAPSVPAAQEFAEDAKQTAESRRHTKTPPAGKTSSLCSKGVRRQSRTRGSEEGAMNSSVGQWTPSGPPAGWTGKRGPRSRKASPLQQKEDIRGFNVDFRDEEVEMNGRQAGYSNDAVGGGGRGFHRNLVTETRWEQGYPPPMLPYAASSPFFASGATAPYFPPPPSPFQVPAAYSPAYYHCPHPHSSRHTKHKSRGEQGQFRDVADGPRSRIEFSPLSNRSPRSSSASGSAPRGHHQPRYSHPTRYRHGYLDPPAAAGFEFYPPYGPPPPWMAYSSIVPALQRGEGERRRRRASDRPPFEMTRSPSSSLEKEERNTPLKKTHSRRQHHHRDRSWRRRWRRGEAMRSMVGPPLQWTPWGWRPSPCYPPPRGGGVSSSCSDDETALHASSTSIPTSTSSAKHQREAAVPTLEEKSRAPVYEALDPVLSGEAEERDAAAAKEEENRRMWHDLVPRVVRDLIASKACSEEVLSEAFLAALHARLENYEISLAEKWKQHEQHVTGKLHSVESQLQKRVAQLKEELRDVQVVSHRSKEALELLQATQEANRAEEALLEHRAASRWKDLPPEETSRLQAEADAAAVREQLVELIQMGVEKLSAQLFPNAKATEKAAQGPQAASKPKPKPSLLASFAASAVQQEERENKPSNDPKVFLDLVQDRLGALGW